MSTIENNENGQNPNDEQLPDYIDDENKKKRQRNNNNNNSAVKKGLQQGAKKVLKNPHVAAFIMAHIIPILIAVAVIVVIIILIGDIAFFLTMPGMVLEKIKQVATGIWANWTGWFTGDQTSAGITQEDIVGLGQYLQDMGYDIESYGFGIPEYEEKQENENLASRTLKKINTSADHKDYLKAYLAANENTYALAEVSLYGGLMEVASGLKRFITVGQSSYTTAQDMSTGMINIINTNSALSNLVGQAKPVDFVRIDRDNERMIVYTNAVYIPIADFLNINDGKVQWGSTFSYDLSSWTSKYGKPLELMLALHLSTMMPDLAYRVANDQSVNTKVNIVLQDVNLTYDTSVKVKNSDGQVVNTFTAQQIIDAFLDYGLINGHNIYNVSVGTKKQQTNSGHNLEGIDPEQVKDKLESGKPTTTSRSQSQQTTPDGGSTTTEVVEYSTQSYEETEDLWTKLKAGLSEEERINLFDDIMSKISSGVATKWFGSTWGINYYEFFANSLIENIKAHFANSILGGLIFDEYYIYVKNGSGIVPTLGITYDSLIELAEIVGRGRKNGIDNVKWPYIESVTNHWFYEDIDFSKGVYRKAKTATKKIKYTPAADDSALVKENIEVELDATLTADEGIVYQVCEPETYGPNQAIIDIFRDKYYRYDGTIKTANQINNAKGYNTLYKGGWLGNSYGLIELIKLFLNTELPEVEEEEVSFEGNKPNALAAFGMLENMHSEEADFVYRSLKDLVVALDYFTEEELTTDLENMMLWLVKTDNKNEKFEIEKNANEFGMTIKNITGRQIVAPENAKVSVLEDGIVELTFTQMSDDTAKLLEFIYEDYYKNINKDILVGMTMKIKGINTNTVVTGDVLRGSVIGEAAEDLQIVMVDIDKSLIENIEIYMRQENNSEYEENMKEKMNKKSNDVGIDIGRASLTTLDSPSANGGLGPNGHTSKFNPNKTFSSVSSVEETIYQTLMQSGYTYEGTCAIMAIMNAESGFNPTAENSDGGYGLIQWTHSRRTNLENWCNNNGYDYSSIEGQMAFFNYELANGFSQTHGYGYPVYETLTTSNDLEYCLTMFFCHDVAGSNVKLTTEGYYAETTKYSTQELYDARLTNAYAYYRYFNS